MRDDLLVGNLSLLSVSSSESSCFSRAQNVSALWYRYRRRQRGEFAMQNSRSPDIDVRYTKLAN